jgi:uncharacterized membrane protein
MHMAEERHLVVTVFESEAKAMSAAEWLMKWERMNKDVDDIRFGAIGVLTAGEDREIKVHRVGKRDAKEGAGLGLIIGALVGAVTAGIGLLGGMAVGALAGGVGGGLIHKGLGMYEGDLADLTDKLCSGRAAVAIVVDETAVRAVTDQLIDLGGEIKVYECSLEALKKAEGGPT